MNKASTLQPHMWIYWADVMKQKISLLICLLLGKALSSLLTARTRTHFANNGILLRHRHKSILQADSFNWTRLRPLTLQHRRKLLHQFYLSSQNVNIIVELKINIVCYFVLQLILKEKADIITNPRFKNWCKKSNPPSIVW